MNAEMPQLVLGGDNTYLKRVLCIWSHHLPCSHQNLIVHASCQVYFASVVSLLRENRSEEGCAKGIRQCYSIRQVINI